ncbi:MAG: hypothetical protein KGN16_26270 [Burkholderiales bacterium]|nr:hypothetical protein [Burkholderiales bacterium]
MSNTISSVSVADHSSAAPDVTEPDGTPTWITRASNLVVAISRVRAGSLLETATCPDEHFVLLPDAPARVQAGAEAREAAADSLLIVPPGPSRIEALAEGWVLRCYSARHAELLARAGNAADFVPPRPGVAPLVDWPAPPGGFRLRVYPLGEHLKAGDKTRVFRSANLMINILRERTEPRDPRAMSPHAHADFEQASVTLSGVHIHHLRWPWTPDMTSWRDDQALQVGSPSVTVIPPQVVHTTRNIGAGPALLIDLFAPPRADFSLRPGMVRNADEYPLPESLQSSTPAASAGATR